MAALCDRYLALSARPIFGVLETRDCANVSVRWVVFLPRQTDTGVSPAPRSGT